MWPVIPQACTRALSRRADNALPSAGRPNDLLCSLTSRSAMPAAPATSLLSAVDGSLDDLQRPLQSPPGSPLATPDALRAEPLRTPARSPNSFYPSDDAFDDSSDAEDAPILRTASVSGHYPNLCAPPHRKGLGHTATPRRLCHVSVACHAVTSVTPTSVAHFLERRPNHSSVTTAAARCRVVWCLKRVLRRCAGAVTLVL